MRNNNQSGCLSNNPHHWDYWEKSSYIEALVYYLNLSFPAIQFDNKINAFFHYDCMIIWYIWEVQVTFDTISSCSQVFVVVDCS